MLNSMIERVDPPGDSLSLDRTDARILLALGADVRISATELAAQLGLSRNTVQAHLLRLERHGLLRFSAVYAQVVSAGLSLTAFVTIELDQRDFAARAWAVAAIPEVIEAYAVAGGDGDLWCRVAARDAADLGRLLDALATCPGVQRTRTSLAIREAVRCRVAPVLQRVASA
jgi:DNA-binding Lrp family transcriptional regulator